MTGEIHLLLVIPLILSAFTHADAMNEREVRIGTGSCINYDSSTATISVACKSANLTDVFNTLNNPRITKEPSMASVVNVDAHLLSKESPKIWLLNANLEVKNGSTFYINSTDTAWLKINSTASFSHNIKAQGNLIIDSVKITGWDTSKKDYARTDKNGILPRSYIMVDYGIEVTNITNSEIAYLGYDHDDSLGLTYYAGADSSIKNNKIHDLWFGFYSEGNAYNITIESNEFYNNSVYGIDPHSGTHDLTIKNNKIYNNGKHGIICSTDCYNILIVSNKVFNNTQEGIILYKNVSNSVIRNNIVHDNRDQIAIYDSSNNNKVYNNSISGGKVGIRVTSGSLHNLIHNNDVKSTEYGIYVLQGGSNNIIESNTITNTSKIAIYVQDNNTKNNIFKNNYLLNNQNDEIKRPLPDHGNALFINNTIKSTRK